MENFNADALLANYKCIAKLKLLNSHLTKVNGEDTATAHKKETIDKIKEQFDFLASLATKNANISIAPIRQDLIATLRRCAVVIPSVSATNNGARPSGSMMMNNVVKAAIRAGRSVMVCFLRRMTPALISG